MRPHIHAAARSTEARLRSLDPATLTPLVRQALGTETAEVTDWAYHPIYEGYQHVFRLSGAGWSLVLKVASPAISGDAQGARHEAAVYRSGVLAHLPGPLAAPRCFAVQEQPHGEWWLWLEEVTADIDHPWSLDHCHVAARQLGQFNGAYLAGRPLPEEPWLNPLGGLLADVASAARSIQRLDHVRDHPLVRRAFPGNTADAFLQLAAERDTLLAALARLPQTFCHHDAHESNLFLRRGPDGRGLHTIAIDWSSAGTGPAGQELGPLIASSLFFTDTELTEVQALDDRISNAYLIGLRDAGWHGDPRVVRFGYAATTALRYGLSGAMGVLRIACEESEHARWEQAYGCPIAEWMDRRAAGRSYFLDLAEEARSLLNVVP